MVSDIRQDMAQFDTLFHLPAAHLRAVTTLAGGSSPWLAYGEEVLDAEMVHAIAPGASIDIVVLPPTALANDTNGSGGTSPGPFGLKFHGEPAGAGPSVPALLPRSR